MEAHNHPIARRAGQRLLDRAEDLDIWAQQAHVYGLDDLATTYKQAAHETRKTANHILTHTLPRKN